ncbi:MAG: ABC transporter substrate-binding protein [Pseudomonadota bacterium]
MKQVLFAALTSAFMIMASASAETLPEAEAFVSELVTELQFAANEHGDNAPEVRQVLEDNLATVRIGKFLVAGSKVEEAEETQREAYFELFPRYIAAAFAEEIGQLTSRRIDVYNSFERAPGDVIVQSKLFDDHGVSRAQIDWRLAAIETEEGDAQGYQLLDVLVERISPLITRRQEFSTIIRDDDVQGLLDHMIEVIGDAQVANAPSDNGNEG